MSAEKSNSLSRERKGGSANADLDKIGANKNAAIQ